MDLEKQQRLIIAAHDYIRLARVPWEKARFDTVSIVLKPKLTITLVRDAFASLVVTFRLL